MFYLKDVLETLTLQTSTIVLSSVFITLAVCVLSRNVLSYEESSTAWTVMFLFVLLMVMIWLIAFAGAYEESYEIISAATILWTVYIITWIGLVVWSLVNTQTNRNVCLQLQCPSGIWLLYNSRRDLQNRLVDSLGQISIITHNSSLRPQYEKTIKPRTIKNVEKYRSMRGEKQNSTATTVVSRATEPIELAENVNDKCTKKVNTDLEIIRTFCGTHVKPTSHLASDIASVIFSILYALILIFSWIVLISYQREMRLQIYFPNHNQEIYGSN